jgi:EmrB/QacA subfamily drug resistance transporter
LCLGNFLILLDTTVVNTAAPDIMTTLDTGIDNILWVLNGYLLALSCLLIVFGRVGDVVGPRNVFVAGLGLFAVASILCGLSQTPGQLIAARVLQGVGAAALLPQALVLISLIFPAERLGLAFGIFTAVAGVASVSGPTVGGLLITEFGWPSIFYVNLPLGLLGIIITLRFVPDVRSRRPHRFDLVGVLLATLGLCGIVYGLVEGQRHHWGPVWGPVTIGMILITSLALLLVFVAWERRHPEPLVPLDLFRSGNFSIATLIALFTSFALYGFLLVFVIETQTVLGMSPLMSGVAALPLTLVLSGVAPLAGRLTDRAGGRVLLIVGLAAYAVGILGVAFLPTRHSTAATFIGPLILVGVGIGTTIAPTTTEAMRDLEPRQIGTGSGVLNTARQVGSALGAAVIGAVLQNRLVESLHHTARDTAAQLPPELRAPFVRGFDDAAARGLQLGSGQNGGVIPPHTAPAGLVDRFNQLVADTFGSGFVPATRPTLSVVAAVLLLGSLLAFFMVRPKLAPSRSSPSSPSPSGGRDDAEANT